MSAAKKHKTIVLQGEWSEYTFKPLLPSSHLRKISKFSRVYRGTSAEGKHVVIKVLPDDTADTLAKRVLAQEHTLYPEAIKQIATGQITPPS